MIMKNGKQIGFIYKNGKKIDKIIRHGKVYFEQGFVREKTDTTLPINFDGIGKNLKDYKIYGNTVQNGTPAPDAPIDIVSCGDKTKNLLGFGATNSGKGTQTTYNKKTGLMTTIGTTTQGYPWVNEFDVNIPSETTLTISSNSQYQIIARLYYNNNNYEEINSTTLSTKTLSHNIIKIVLLINVPANTTINETYYVQIEEGSTATPCEPYGYKIPVNVRSDNLFDKNNITLEKRLDPNGIFYNDSGYYTTSYIEVSPNTQYIKNSPSENAYHRICFYDTNKSFIIASNSNVYTTPSNAKYIRFCGLQTELSSAMYVIGSTVPSKYIPYYNETTYIYLDEPLRKIGDYSDYIDFVNGKVVRNIKEKIFNGSESWYSYNQNLYLQNITDYKKGSNYIPLCTHYKGANQTKGTQTPTTNNNKTIRFSDNNTADFYRLFVIDTDFSNSSSFKTWLESNNIIVDYILITPIQKSIELPNIPTINGNNTLNIETEITPSQVYIKYKSNN